MYQFPLSKLLFYLQSDTHCDNKMNEICVHFHLFIGNLNIMRIPTLIKSFMKFCYNLNCLCGTMSSFQCQSHYVHSFIELDV